MVRFNFDEYNIDIMGNPFHINKKSCDNLKYYGISSYQLSLDGMEKRHDLIRKKGSFGKTIEAINFLKEAGINVHIMFTLSKTNAEDLFPLVELLVNMGVDGFAFARMSKPEFMPIKDYLGISFSPGEYKEYLSRVKSLYDHFSSNDKYHTHFALKDHLWKLFMFEKGELLLNDDIGCEPNSIIYSGCNLGVSNLSILSDGTVYACRRFKSEVGKVPEEKILDIFLNSERLNYYRQLEKFSKCSKCQLAQYCRGCGAVAFNQTGSYFDPDPQCWKVIE
jgi:radical SAM protein with 4Fe4S-binding SPASM domain